MTKASQIKRALPYLGAAIIVGWIISVTLTTCGHDRADFSSGGGMVVSGGGGLAKVTTNSAGLLAGSGTTSNPLTATITTSSPGIVAGTGSSGSGLTVTVSNGSGLAGTGSSGDVLRVGAGSGIDVDASNVVAKLGTGLTYSAGAIVPNLTGGTCSNGRAATSLSSAGTVTCGDVGRNDYAGTHFEWSDEFMVGTTSLSTQTLFLNGQWPFTTATGCGTSANIGTTTRPGIMEWVTNTSSGSACNAISSTTAIDFGSGSWTFEATLGVPNLADVTDVYYVLAGFYNVNNAIDQTNGCYFVYDQADASTNPGSGTATGGNFWEIFCVASSVRTGYTLDGQTEASGDGSFVTISSAVAALTLPSTNIYHLKIIMTLASQADFYINGTKVGQILTNIPTGAARTASGIGIRRTNTGSNNRKLDIDWARVAVDLTSARTP